MLRRMSPERLEHFQHLVCCEAPDVPGRSPQCRVGIPPAPGMKLAVLLQASVDLRLERGPCSVQRFFGDACPLGYGRDVHPARADFVCSPRSRSCRRAHFDPSDPSGSRTLSLSLSLSLSRSLSLTHAAGIVVMQSGCMWLQPPFLWMLAPHVHVLEFWLSHLFVSLAHTRLPLNDNTLSANVFNGAASSICFRTFARSPRKSCHG